MALLDFSFLRVRTPVADPCIARQHNQGISKASICPSELMSWIFSRGVPEEVSRASIGELSSTSFSKALLISALSSSMLNGLARKAMAPVL